ncbi:hypothetical protein BDV12DRAFT_161681 [Aspergillus spectabilis]
MTSQESKTSPTTKLKHHLGLCMILLALSKVSIVHFTRHDFGRLFCFYLHPALHAFCCVPLFVCTEHQVWTRL